MKIRFSLRLYFFVSMLILSSIMAISFSLLSVSTYIDGLDKGLKGIMFSLSQNTELGNAKSKVIMGFNVASRWEDTPEIIQKRFSQPTIAGFLYKETDQSSIFLMPENIYFIVYYTTSKGEPRYVSRIMLEKDRPEPEAKINPEKRIAWIVITGFLAISSFVFFLIMVMRKVAKPIEYLRSWAKSLNQQNVMNPPPDFNYNELNVLAEIIRSSLISTHASLNREKTFLSYASHELRTPISVIRSNVELLNRLSDKTPLSEKQNSTIGRIERAALTMCDLTNTLLWLSRNDNQQIEIVTVDLQEKIDTLCQELAYLLNGKQVEVVINKSSKNSRVITEATGCHIVLTNLIRNAFQHTQIGKVEIILKNSCITIINSNKHNEYDHHKNNIKTTIGYGLGLQLSERIIKRHNWFYNIRSTPDRYEVKVDFGNQ